MLEVSRVTGCCCFASHFLSLSVCSMTDITLVVMFSLFSSVFRLESSGVLLLASLESLLAAFTVVTLCSSSAFSVTMSRWPRDFFVISIPTPESADSRRSMVVLRSVLLRLAGASFLRRVVAGVFGRTTSFLLTLNAMTR